MKVRVVAHTMPYKNAIEGAKSMEDIIAYCAKVSNPLNQNNLETSGKLIEYLIKHQHWSPFEMVNAVIEIDGVTRDIAHQLVRHRSFTFQEFSQRYQDVTVMEGAFVTKKARMQHPTNRQDSIETEDEELNKAWEAKQRQLIHEAKLTYKWALDNGIAKEVARVVLPEGNTVSRLYVNGTIRSWIHYLQLRTANGTQKEHIDLAREIAIVIAEVFPLTSKLIKD